MSANIGFTHHGAVEGVTGSCHQLHFGDGRSLLVDCGLFQGEEGGEDALARHRIEFSLAGVQALVATHVHIDHIGRLPYLFAAGFDGPILCSEPSAKLLPLVIEDALKIGFTRDRQLIERFLERVEAHLIALPYGRWHTLIDDASRRVRVKLQRAGHILGSAYVEVDVLDKTISATPRQSQRVVFSGDLGAPYSPLLPAPRSPYRADVVVLESTYGDRLHEDRRHRRSRLKAALERALADGGTVLIPAFSIGRTQELLYELEGLIHEGAKRGERVGGRGWDALEIIVDSPLAARFTEVYRELAPFWDAEARRRVAHGRHPLDFDSLYTVNSHEEHERAVAYLAKTGRPAVVLAASGMAAGGRIVNYLKAMIGEPRHNVLFVGYQAEGTPGRAIQEYGPKGGWVELDGERFTIRAGVESLTGYSAHADRQDLVNFIRRMRHWPRQVRLVHGDADAKQALKEALLAEAKRHEWAMEVVIDRAAFD
ncbi:metallo-beta-lactamase family protein [Modicisalibacter ilicicola DSM 19980]|uniref:Metallo-beta-lactamase family protein n=1 Tax=Modicisalibacter ilicicola DSM 19980 TaxID=1121942 RepID=A0A1M5EMD1_9GAMM|nr:MBL fold metallo-hydrolase [Halomonas ilicicola]SHF80448.1 metallo-beta-lactamase family protein [Halomonas ilicicola DSM 19980]